ncbi:MAG TPA: hypothetical protein VFB87_01010 [Gaiellaceae bacterium]|jgi:hypothetical protein|nr:hypothetical protein [Gaiellaceae bacterium]
MSSPVNRRRRLAPALLLSFAVAAAGAAAALPARASESVSELEPQSLVRAKAIRTHVNARYRRLSGRQLAVTEVTSMGVVESVSLMTDPVEPLHVVPARNGIYFALCSVRANCPYPARSAAWPAAAFRPRRQALELAVRVFSRTTADLVVVALPTRSPTWIVFERADVFAEVGATLRDQLAGDPGFADAGLRAIVDRLTRERTFVPLEVMSVGPGRETFVAVAHFGK